MRKDIISRDSRVNRISHSFISDRFYIKTKYISSQVRTRVAPYLNVFYSRHPTIFKQLLTAPYVFLRRDASRGILQTPYEGPYKVVARSDKNLTLSINNKNVKVSIGRLKLAFTVTEDLQDETSTPEITVYARANAPSEESRPAADPAGETGNNRTEPVPQPRVTRAGRNVRFPDRYQAGFS